MRPVLSQMSRLPPCWRIGLAASRNLFWCLVLITIAASGCGYRAGKVSPGFSPELKTIAIPIFKNISPEPLIETSLTEAVREEFINDGRLKLVPEDRADLILRGKITGYGTRTLAFDALDRASEVRVMVGVRLSLIEKQGGKELASFDLQARSEYPLPEKLSEIEQAKEAAELRAFGELAEKLTELLLSGL